MTFDNDYERHVDIMVISEAVIVKVPVVMSYKSIYYDNISLRKR